jgi:hypothetical protein
MCVAISFCIGEGYGGVIVPSVKVAPPWKSNTIIPFPHFSIRKERLSIVAHIRITSGFPATSSDISYLSIEVQLREYSFFTTKDIIGIPLLHLSAVSVGLHQYTGAYAPSLITGISSVS